MPLEGGGNIYLTEKLHISNYVNSSVWVLGFGLVCFFPWIMYEMFLFHFCSLFCENEELLLG